MNDPTPFAQQMVAAAPAATRNGRLPSGAGLGMGWVVQGNLSQQGLRDGVSCLVSRANVN